jgi:hypothetical protein
MRSVLLGLMLVLLQGGLPAQTPSTPLSDYVGTYIDAPGQTIEIVSGRELFAVLDGAKYRLHPTGRDEFSNVAGKKIPFRRDAAGKVAGYEEDGKFHPRISSTVTFESAALARPRPQGQDSPSDYLYHPPTDLLDGIAVGDIAQSELGVATANSIVRAVLDGTYEDVHSVLLYLRHCPAPVGDERAADRPSSPVARVGQKIYLVPQYELVAVFTGGAYNVDGTPPNAIMSKMILPALMSARSNQNGRPTGK